MKPIVGRKYYISFKDGYCRLGICKALTQKGAIFEFYTDYTYYLDIEEGAIIVEQVPWYKRLFQNRPSMDLSVETD